MPTFLMIQSIPALGWFCLDQSIVLSTIFAGYGLALWGDVDQLTAFATALVVTAGLIGTLLLWRRYFELGPFEWVLRRITHARLAI